jgi:hypothetical protein
MASCAVSLGTAGIILVNVILLSVRFFARSQGLEVRWWSRSYASERRHLRALARSSDQPVANRARWYLRLEMAAWVLFVVFAIAFFWGVATR